MKINDFRILGSVKLCLLIGLVSMLSPVNAQQIIPLYKDSIPNSLNAPDKEFIDKYGNVFKSSVPNLIAYLPQKTQAVHTAVILCPGGGYQALVMGAEFTGVAKELCKLGIASFILKYRLPDPATMRDPSLGPIEDAQQAIKLIRENAKDWNIDPDRIGVMGFSAGGHLAATLGTHFNHPYIENKQKTNLRPDFMLLVYPVISMIDSLTHPDSKRTLLGVNPSPDKVIAFSNELQVSKKTPPTFLMHASDDQMVPVNNSIEFYEALIKHRVPAGLHVFSKGRHGFVLEPAKSNYLKYCELWLQENGWLSP